VIVFSLVALLTSSVLCVVARATVGTANGSVLDAGDEVVITSPNATDEWRIGTTHEITWSSVGDFSYVSIVLCPGWASQTIISDNTSNDGSFEWVVQPAWYGGPASYYWVRISNVGDSMVFDDSDSFFLYMGAISVSSPSSGETLQAGGGYQIAWWSDTAGAEVTIELYKGGAYDSTITASWGNSNGYSYYDWYTPSKMIPGDNFQVKVTSLSDSSIYDYSDNFSITSNPWLNVTSPSLGDRWGTGTTHSITWASYGAEALVNISLYNPMLMGYWFRIASDEENDGVYDWTIPFSQTIATNYEVVVEIGWPTYLSDYGDYFEIFGPSINVTSPTGNLTWEGGESHAITWTSYDAGNDVKIDLYNYNWDTIYPVVSSTENDGSYIWTAPINWNYYPSSVRIEVSSISKPGVMGHSEYFSMVPTTRQTFIILSPSLGENLARGMEYRIQWSSVNNPGPYVSLELFQSGSYVSTITPFVSNEGYFWWNIPHDVVVGDECEIKITSFYNSSACSLSGSFSIFDSSDQGPVPGWISVTSPYYYDVWWSGSTHLIQWNQAGGSGGTVSIELCLNGSWLSTITPSTSNNGSYLWTVPFVLPSPDYQIEIVSTSDSSVYDLSERFAIIPPQPWIKLESYGIYARVNETTEIRWTSGNDAGEYVSIEVLRYSNLQGSSRWVWEFSIASNTSNDGSFTWTPAFGPSTNDQYNILVMSLSKNWIFDRGSLGITSVWIDIEAPVEDEVLTMGSSYEIRWSSNDIGDKVNIGLDWGYETTLIAENTTNDGSFIWTLPQTLLPGHGYEVWVSSPDPSGRGDEVGQIAIAPSGTMQEIAVTSPNGAESWSVGTQRSITWTSTSGVGNVSIELYHDGSYESTIALDVADSHVYEWTIPSSLKGGSGHSIKIVSFRNADVFDYSNQSFTIVALPIRHSGVTI
jgi:hypothetical protein